MPPTPTWRIVDPPLSRIVKLKLCLTFSLRCFSTAKKSVEVGLEDGKIPNRAFTSSSKWDKYHRADRARLNTVANKRHRGAWSSRKNNKRQWIQVKLGQKTRITGVVTQGRQDANQWVTSYSISYSLYGRKFRPYRENGRVKVTVLVEYKFIRSSFTNAVLIGLATHYLFCCR